jgi:hypothetical protein
MPAYGVQDADILNDVELKFGIPASLIQAMRDFEGSRFLTLPDGAQEYAKQYASLAGKSTAANKQGLEEPEAHFHAVGWWLSKAISMRGGVVGAVDSFYDSYNMGRMSVMKIISTYYPRRKKQFS